MVTELSLDKLRRICDPAEVGCNTSAEVTQLDTIIGQERAVRAMRFGLGIGEKGFNIYVTGMPGTGRTTAVRRFLEEVAQSKPTPPDWVYVNNFHDSYHPEAFRLPAGKAVEFQKDMENLLKVGVQEIRNTFESEEYGTHKQETVNKFQQQKQAVLDKLGQIAQEAGFAIQGTPMGLLTIPLKRGKPLSQEEFIGLGQEEKEAIMQRQQKLEAVMEASIRQTKQFDKEMREGLQNLDKEVALYALSHHVGEVKAKYADLPEVVDYVQHVQDDILENIAQLKQDGEEDETVPGLSQPGKKFSLKKYAVNVLVDNSSLKGAPVVLETNPTYDNLFGRVEHEASFGALVTDFTLVRKGVLHSANGGYLVLPAEDLLRAPGAWEYLKRALVNRKIIIEDIGDRIGFVTKGLRPQPIPLDIKVVLIGRPDVYQLLLAYDDDFRELFKVRADFDYTMELSPEHIREYVSFASLVVTTENLKHLDCSALAQVIEHGSRLADDQTKLSTRFGEIADVIREANYYASQENSEYTLASHVSKAVDERFYRSSLIQERIREMITRGVIKIEVGGEQVGQINGLSVLDAGDIAFGQPSRITVAVSLGREGVVDIEREAKLGGPIHTKGVMILSGFLAGRYAQDKPLSLSARVVFEQSYSGVEGDSASSTELYAILSALSGLPIRQSIAVTGSVNQKGEVQAIGGVNEKIEGFFEVCRTQGLSGEQGVMIPQSNIENLMLKDQVLEAVRNGQFHIWAVSTIDEGIEVLTGVPAGQRLPDGSFEAGSINEKVDRRLRQMADAIQAFGASESKGRREPA